MGKTWGAGEGLQGAWASKGGMGRGKITHGKEKRKVLIGGREK